MTAPIKAATIDELRAAGAPQLFTQTSAGWKAIFTQWWEDSEDGPKRKLYPAQTETLLIDMLSYGFALLGQEAQAASEQRWLAFAVGGHADLLAANNSTFRLKAQPAATILRFTVTIGQGGSTVVPAGTRATTADERVFATTDDLVIDPGFMSGDVAAVAAEPGSAHNDVGAGVVDRLLDSVDGIGSVSNVTVSAGGAEAETDEALAGRAADAHNRISKAGSRASYDATTRGFSPSIIDVAVIRPQPGHIHIHPLIDDGQGVGAPTAQFLADLRAYLDPVDTRPQGDDVSVLAPTEVALTAEATITAIGDLALIEAACLAAIASVGDALERQLGPFVAGAAFTCALKAIAGVIDAEIAFPGLLDRQLGETQFFRLESSTVTVIEAGHG